MALFLQILIALVLVVLCACLVPLLLQLRRTAASLQALAESAKVDLNAISGDLHQVRTRVDQVADLTAASMALPASLGEMMATLARTLPDMLGRPSSGWIGLLLSGIRLLFSGTHHPKEKAHE
jgi:hypothetical protein